MKRAFDVALSGLVLVMTAPIIAAAALAVKLGSPGPAIYKGTRVGRDGRVFQMYKLRTMRIDGAGPAVTSADDPRLTAVGRVLRRAKIDELPQLVNVLKGEMSLVGPRPEHPDLVRRYPSGQRDSLAVRPGITGPSALEFIDEEAMLAGTDPVPTYVEAILPRKLAIDRDYVQHASFGRDLGILVNTCLMVLSRPFRRGAGARSRSRPRSRRRRPDRYGLD